MGGEKLKKSILALILCTGLFAQIQTVFAQEEPAAEEDPLRAAERVYPFDEGASASRASGYSILTVVRMVMTLALAAAAIYGIVFFIKRSSKKSPDSDDPFLKILASSHLGSNRYAHIVAVGSKAWLLGSSDGGVNLIGEIDDKDIINAMLLEDSRKAAEKPVSKVPDFLSVLRRFGVSLDTRTPGADNIRKRNERLKGL